MKSARPLCTLLDQLKPTQANVPASLTVSGITRDSRGVKPGSLFVAIRGTETDGNSFIQKARQLGAAVVVSEDPPDGNGPWVQVPDARAALAELSGAFFHYPDQKLNLTGITGTNGKTTTAYLLRAILQAAGFSCGMMTTVEYAVADKTTPAIRTTPEASEICENLAAMVASGQQHAVMEVTSHAIALKRTHGLEFKRAIFTNFSHEHLDFHRTPEAYMQAKYELFRSLDSKSMAILNADDAVARSAGGVANCEVVTYGVRNEAHVTARMVSDSTTGMQAVLNLRGIEVKISSRFHGDHNLSNITAAAATAWTYGIAPDVIKTGIRNLATVPGRMEEIPAGHAVRVFVDFAHTPDALEHVLRACRKMCSGKLHVVFGCGGERDHEKRPLMGRIASEMADQVILTTDNPRREKPENILRDIRSGIPRGAETRSVPGREIAIRETIAGARAGDVVLIAGRGHETHQEIDGRRLPLDDREVAKRMIEELQNGSIPAA